MISFLKKSFYDPLLGDINFLFFFQKKSLLSGGPRPPVNPAAYWVWLTKVVPSIFWVQWVHIRAFSVDIDASGSFWGSLKGLEFPM